MSELIVTQQSVDAKIVKGETPSPAKGNRNFIDMA